MDSEFIRGLVAAGGMTFLAGFSLGILFGLYIYQRNNHRKE